MPTLGLLYWARGEASRKAYQMKRETEAATRRDNVKANSHKSQWHFPSTMAPAVQWNEPDTLLYPVRYAAQK